MVLEAGKSKGIVSASSWHLVRAYLLSLNMEEGIIWQEGKRTYVRELDFIIKPPPNN